MSGVFFFNPSYLRDWDFFLQKVKLSSSPQEFLPSNLVSNQQWQQLNGQFKIVDWQRLPGKTFVNKMEYMMACLAIKSS